MANREPLLLYGTVVGVIVGYLFRVEVDPPGPTIRMAYLPVWCAIAGCLIGWVAEFFMYKFRR
jgi:hypothetical protein